MHTEHLNNLHPGWVVGGWLVAVAVTSAVYLAIVGIGLLPAGAGAAVGVLFAMAVGFYAGGLFVGAALERRADPPCRGHHVPEHPGVVPGEPRRAGQRPGVVRRRPLRARHHPPAVRRRGAGRLDGSADDDGGRAGGGSGTDRAP